jgi:hypothetical protein
MRNKLICLASTVLNFGAIMGAINTDILPLLLGY